MRTKILLFPLLFLIIISAIIWMIVPDWKIVQQKRKDLDAKEKQLKEIKRKNLKIDELTTIFGQKAEEVGVIQAYIPSELGNADIIGNLIANANQQGALRVSDISINEGKAGKISSSPAKNQEISIGEILDFGGEKMKIGEAPAGPTLFDIKISLEGGYVGLKDFFTKINSLKRSNEIKSFNISKGEGENLKMDAVIGMNYVEKYNPQVVDGLSLGENLDLRVVEAIKNKATVDFSKISADTEGKANPFLP